MLEIREPMPTLQQHCCQLRLQKQQHLTIPHQHQLQRRATSLREAARWQLPPRPGHRAQNYLQLFLNQLKVLGGLQAALAVELALYPQLAAAPSLAVPL
jgi:hypothetical protein